jgi:hypothetical protein
MIELVAGKLRSGDLYINIARRHLALQEWGMALRAVEKGFQKGS